MSTVIASMIAKIGAETSGFEKGAAGVKNGLVNLVTNTVILTAVIKGLEEGFKQTVGVAQEYDQSVRDLMLSTGGGAEATSRLIQVVDDAGVSYDTLKTAMKFAVKNGIEPSTESLMKLSDQYLALAPGVERGQFLLERFGKSGLDMARVMELGSNKIKDMNGNIEAGLVLTDASIQASEEYRMNLDMMQDSVESVKIALGNGLLPVINSVIGGWKTLNNETENTNRLLAEARNVTNTTWNEYQLLSNAERDAAEMQAGLNLSIRDGHSDAERLISTNWNVVNAYNAEQAAISGTVLSLEEQKVAQEAMNEANRNFLSTLGSVASAEESFASTSKDLVQQRIDLEQQRAEAIQAGWWEGSDKIKGFDDALAENAIKTQENAAAHDVASKQIILGLIEQKFMQDGLLDDRELQFLLDKGQAWGIYSQTVIDETNRAMLEVAMLLGTINQIPSSKQFTLIVQQQGSLQGSAVIGGGGKRFASGGEFTIPASFGDEGFSLGGMATASGGETVTIGAKGGGQDSGMAAMIASSMPTERGIGRAVARELAKAGIGATR
jgi:hypothetical protein